MAFVLAENSECLSPAERMRRIRETRIVIPDADWDPLSFWTEHGILGIPGAGNAPRHLRHDRVAVRRYVAREDWKQRCKVKRRVSPRIRSIVIEMAGSRCEYCGRRLQANEVEIDHVIPVTRGGRSYLRNLAASCGNCNESKSDQLLEEWLDRHHARLREAGFQAARQVLKTVSSAR